MSETGMQQSVSVWLCVQW